MRYDLFEGQRDAVLLIARILLVVLFVLFGWNEKLMGFAGTVQYFSAIHLPLPTVAAVIALIMELGVGVAIAVGFWTRPLALLLAVYTLATAFIGHHYWSVPAPEHMESMINFYKNISIVGGLLVLCVAGPGRFSIDRK